MSFKSSFGALEDAGGSWLGFGILILIWIWSLVFGTHIFQILALYLDFEGAKNIHVLKSSFGALEDAGGSWLGFGILMLIWIWSLVLELALAFVLGSSIFQSPKSGLKWHGGFLHLQNQDRAKICIISISKTRDHIQIKIKMPNPSQEPPASSKDPNKDLKDMDVLCTLKFKIESRN